MSKFRRSEALPPTVSSEPFGKRMRSAWRHAAANTCSVNLNDPPAQDVAVAAFKRAIEEIEEPMDLIGQPRMVLVAGH